MALVRCLDCGVEVSDSARVCPKCGRGRPGQPPPLPLAGRVWPAKGRWAFLIAAVVGGLLILGLALSESAHSRSQQQWMEQSNKRGEKQRASEAVLSDLLKSMKRP